MRIAYLVNQYPKVSHTFIRREIEALEAEGFTVERIALRDSGEPLVDPADQRERERTYVVLGRGIARLIPPLLRVMTLRPAKFFAAATMALRLARRSAGSWGRHLAYLAEAASLISRYSAGRIEHVHAHFGTNSTAVALLWRLLGGPGYSFTVHGPEEFDSPRGLGLDLKIAEARFVCGVSDYGRSQLMRWCPADQWTKLHVVRCGLDEAMLSAELTPVPDNRRLVCVGRLCEQKGHGVLIEAVCRLKRSGLDFDLVLVGDGPLRTEIESAIERHGLSRAVRITGWKSSAEVADEIRASRALVLPSFAEGLPVVLMEALALGRPVISTYVAGIPELVDEGCGWLVPAGALEPLCDALRQAFAADVVRLTEMGRDGSRRVADRHRARSEAKNLAAHFRDTRPRLRRDKPRIECLQSQLEHISKLRLFRNLNPARLN